MRFFRAATLVLALLLAVGCVEPDPPTYLTDTPPSGAVPRPYAGEEARAIKALSAEEIAGYEKGAGLGYAKPAELNSYPGPLHALEMSERLGLSEGQRADLSRLRETMLTEAIPLGQQYLAIEAAIERHFRDADMEDARLRELLDESARIEAALRYAHLQTHVATKALLTPHQIALYDEARGYADAQPSDHASHEHGA